MMSLGQARAAFALERVRPHSASKEYRDDSRGLPGMLAVNGLLTVLLHDGGKLPVRDLAAWLTSGGVPGLPGGQGQDLAGVLTRCSSAQYQCASAEALSMATWLKHWAQALFTPEPEPADGQPEQP
jgi:CRISPR/Cas system CMR-associated protein Cmr5 small subunit